MPEWFFDGNTRLQREEKGAPLSRRALAPDLPSQVRNDFPTDRESEAGPFRLPRLIAAYLIELLEDFFPILRFDPMPRVPDKDGHITSIQLCPGDNLSGGGKFDCIVQEIAHHLAETFFIPLNRGELRKGRYPEDETLLGRDRCDKVHCK